MSYRETRDLVTTDMSTSYHSLDIYIHFPFCNQKCAYCYIPTWRYTEQDADRYVQALLHEITRRRVDAAGRLRSIFFGGGTPSLLSAESVARLMEAICARYPLAADTVVTLEVSPLDVTLEAIRSFSKVGINRTSMGIQSFNEHVLRTIRRPHSPAEAITAVKTLREGGIQDIGIELMWAIVPFPLPTILDDLAVAADLPVDHVTTMWYDIYRPDVAGRPAPPAHHELTGKGYFYGEEAMIDVYEKATRFMRQRGFRRVATDEFRRSNLHVPAGLCLNGPALSYTGNGALIGYGLGAVSSIGPVVTCYDSGLEEYIADPLAPKNLQQFTPEELVWFRLIYDLLVPGCCERDEYVRFACRESAALDQWFDCAVKLGFLTRANACLTLTDRGAAWFNFSFGVENYNSMAEKVKRLFL